VVNVAADRTSGHAPLTVNFDPAGTHDPDNQDLTYAWDFDGNGTTDSTVEGPVSFTYTANGQYQARRYIVPITCATTVHNRLIQEGARIGAVGLLGWRGVHHA
jgi:hypothetical protein